MSRVDKKGLILSDFSSRCVRECAFPHWEKCSGCNGRVHQRRCNAKKIPSRDCCANRHKRIVERVLVTYTEGMSAEEIRRVDETTAQRWLADLGSIPDPAILAPLVVSFLRPLRPRMHQRAIARP
jgi:hypothetical protein